MYANCTIFIFRFLVLNRNWMASQGFLANHHHGLQYEEPVHSRPGVFQFVFCSILGFPALSGLLQPRLENQEFQWLEFFAGTAACTHAMRDAGFRGARFDKMYCKDHKKHGRKTNWMDILTPSGFVLLGCIFFAILNLELNQLSCRNHNPGRSKSCNCLHHEGPLL